MSREHDASPNASDNGAAACGDAAVDTKDWPGGPMIETSVAQDGELAVHTCVGRVSVEDILRATEALHEAGAPKNSIWDLREADLTEILTDQVESLARTIKKIVPEEAVGKTAIVVACDLAFGLGRAYQAYADVTKQAEDIMIFRTIEEAHEWLSAA